MNEQVTALDGHRAARARRARRPLVLVGKRKRGRAGPRGGRVWVNGRELGGEDARFGHLAGGHD